MKLGQLLKKMIFDPTLMDGDVPKYTTTTKSKKDTKKEQSHGIFDDIVGYDKLKTIFYKSLESDKPVHILLVGPPAIGKTMFLSAIAKKFAKETVEVIGDKTSGSGLIDKLFEKQPKYVCIDEIGLLDNGGQTSILNMMETGKVIESFKTRSRDMTLNSWVFATSNDGDLIEPLKSRFMVFYLKSYSYEQFAAIAAKKLEGSAPELVEAMCNAVWFKMKSKDPRDVVKLGRVCKTVEEVADTVETMVEYSE